MNLKKLISPICLTTGLLLSLSTTAGAITFNLTTGTNGGVPNSTGGAFSSQPGVTTADFNSATATTNTTGLISATLIDRTTTYTYTSGIATYTWSARGAVVTPQSTTNFTTGSNAPPGPGGQANSTRYLAVIDEPVTITFSSPLKYFGLDWGAAYTSDQIQFFNSTISNTTPLATFTAPTVFGRSPLPTNPQLSSYVDFLASGTETFDKIILSHSGSDTAFQTDNHAFSTQAVPFEFSPGVGILGLAAIGGVAQLKSQIQKWRVSRRSVLG